MKHPQGVRPFSPATQIKEVDRNQPLAPPTSVHRATEAGRRSVDGIICGHIHHAADRMIAGTHYLNCGDWVESCTAIVETLDGQLRVIQWSAREAVVA